MLENSTQLQNWKGHSCFGSKKEIMKRELQAGGKNGDRRHAALKLSGFKSAVSMFFPSSDLNRDSAKNI